MKKSVIAFATIFSLFLLAAPVCFSEAGTPSITTKTLISLPLKKSTKSVVCVNRNYNDTQKFGNAFCAALDEYSFDCIVKLAEFVPKEAVVGYDYVWTFQVKSWKDKNLDDIPEHVSAVIFLYDRDFNLLLKSNVSVSKSKDPQAPNCLETLVTEYLRGLFNDVIEVKQSEPAEGKAQVNEEESTNKKEKAKKAPKEKKEKKPRGKKAEAEAAAETSPESAAENNTDEKQAE